MASASSSSIRLVARLGRLILVVQDKTGFMQKIISCMAGFVRFFLILCNCPLRFLGFLSIIQAGIIAQEGAG